MSEATAQVNRKARIGTVVSDKNDQTIIVVVERTSRHLLYRQVVRRTKRYPVHDPENAATVGDFVRIEECRPISKTKRWRLAAVLTERDVAEVAPESIGEVLVDEMQRTAARAASEADAASGIEEPPAEPSAESSAADAVPADEAASEAPAADAVPADEAASEAPAEAEPAEPESEREPESDTQEQAE